MSSSKTYSEFFDLDQTFYPTINASVISDAEKDDPKFWMRTYPHQYFIEMLEEFEKILSSEERGKSLQIEGVYGTGKSQCAWALMRLLTATEEEVKEYWNKPGARNTLGANQALLQKLLGHKSRTRMVTAYRYSSSEITSDARLFAAVQESIREALKRAGCEYGGQRSLRDSIVDWLSKPSNLSYFDQKIHEEYMRFFDAFGSASAILNTLKNAQDAGEVLDLVDKIVEVGFEAGFTPLTITAESLSDWIRDVVAKNNITLIFFWDEFTDYFKANQQFSAFQRLLELCDEVPFRFVILTLDMAYAHSKKSSIVRVHDSLTRVLNRFKPVEIKLPDNVAFELIGDAMRLKKDSEQEWKKEVFPDLAASTRRSRAAVVEAGKMDDKTVARILPLHPMTAYLLKHLAASFGSNQRSMFEYLMGRDEKTGFRLFLNTHSPYVSSDALLSIDCLWDYFCGVGGKNLPDDMRDILDGYWEHEGKLSPTEQAVLKTVLIMHALAQAYRWQKELLNPTEQNLELAFDGIDQLQDGGGMALVKGLCKKGILFEEEIRKNVVVYRGALQQTGNSVDETRLQKLYTPAKLALDAQISTQHILPASLWARFVDQDKRLSVVAAASPVYNDENDFVGYETRAFEAAFDNLCNENPGQRFRILLAVARQEGDAEVLRDVLRKLCEENANKDIVVVDASAVQFGADRFKRFLEFKSKSEQFKNVDSRRAESCDQMADDELAEWRKDFINGSYTVWYGGDAKKAETKAGLARLLQDIVKNKWKEALEFTDGLTENMIRSTAVAQAFEGGLIGRTAGAVSGIEQRLFPKGKIWQKSNYWLDEPAEPVSRMKIALDKYIEDEWSKTGQVSLSGIWSFLANEFGFVQSNLYYFLCGFLLTEYGNNDKLRINDTKGASEPANPTRLKNAFKDVFIKNPKEVWIVQRTKEELAFANGAETAWGADPEGTREQIAARIIGTLRDRRFPMRFLQKGASREVYDLGEDFISFANASVDQKHDAINTIGQKLIAKPTLAEDLRVALEPENFKTAASEFLREYRQGILVMYAENLAGENGLICDVREKFSRDYQALWNEKTQDEQLDVLANEYQFAIITNAVFKDGNPANNYQSALDKWREKLLRFPVSRYSLPEIPDTVASVLLCVAKGESFLPEVLVHCVEDMKAEELREIFCSDKTFRKSYESLFDNQELTDDDFRKLATHPDLEIRMFLKSASECCEIVDRCAQALLNEKKQRQLVEMWKKKTDSDCAEEWSDRNIYPIQCLLDPEEFAAGEAAFRVLNDRRASDAQVAEAERFFCQTDLFRKMQDEAELERAFVSKFIPEKKQQKLVSYKEVRKALKESKIPVFQWFSHPNAKYEIDKLVDVMYMKGGRERALKLVDSMDPEKLATWLKEIIAKNDSLGMEILASEPEQSR